jgi:hypothetical protein
MVAAMEFAALVFQGKLPPLLAADDSSQILNRSVDRSSVRKEPTMGGVSHRVRGIQVFTRNLSLPNRVVTGIRLERASVSASEDRRGPRS